MANPTASPPPGPDNEAVRQRLLAWAESHPRLFSVRTVLHTDEGRPIDAATISDPGFPDEHKQHVLLVGGQHGNEESARLMALSAIEYLLSEAGRPLLQAQKVVVMPNISPDAAARDAYETPAGIRPNLDHGPDGPRSNEAKAVEMVANELMPEVYVDMHARGYSGASFDMVLFPPAKSYTEDEMLLHAIAREMAREAERSGIPNMVHPLTWSGWGGPDLNQPSSTLWMYRQFKSLVFLTETAEHNDVAYPEAMRIASGLGRLRSLLAMGSQRHPKLYYPGYPCSMAVGMFSAGVVAVGRTAADRRRSRVSIWQQSPHFRKVTAVLPEQALSKTLKVEYAGETLRDGVGFQMAFAGRHAVEQVYFDGRRLDPGELDGYYHWHDDQVTYIVAAVPVLEPGEHEITYTCR